MVLRRMTKQFKISCLRCCGWKKKYNMFNVFLRFIRLRNKKENVVIYKCHCGDHYHVGHKNKSTKRTIKKIKNYKYNKLTLAFIK